MEINERFRLIRKSLKMTQEEFASALGCSRNVVKNIELNLSPPSGTMLNLVCKLYSVNEVWLRTGEGEQYAESPAEDRFFAKIGDYASDGTDPRKKIILSHIMEIMDGIPDDYLEKVADIIIDAAEELQKLKSEE